MIMSITKLISLSIFVMACIVYRAKVGPIEYSFIVMGMIGAMLMIPIYVSDILDTVRYSRRR
jgi:hypothetical protein